QVVRVTTHSQYLHRTPPIQASVSSSSLKLYNDAQQEALAQRPRNVTGSTELLYCVTAFYAKWYNWRKKTRRRRYFLMMDNVTMFPRTKLRETFAVTQLVSFHYFEFPKDFAFEGEKHDFWEFVYVDKGELEVFADTEGYCLK